jgi:hypothetical protein
MRQKPAFAEAIKEATSVGLMENLMTVKAASAKSWQAAAWLIERRFPNEWGRRQTIKVEKEREDSNVTEAEQVKNAQRLYDEIFGLNVASTARVSGLVNPAHNEVSN